VKKDRYDDALNATRAAVEEPGEESLPKASLALSANSPRTSNLPTNPDTKPVPTVNFNQDLGVTIIRRALTHPAHTILTNAGEEASVIFETLCAQYGSAERYDAQQGEYVDMIKTGIFDSLQVVLTALVDASEVVSLLTMSEACVVDAPEENKPAGGPGGVCGFFKVSFLLNLSRLTPPCITYILPCSHHRYLYS
jgi:chaperonin GroEL